MEYEIQRVWFWCFVFYLLYCACVCLSVCMFIVCMQEHVEVRRGRQLTWNWSQKQLQTTMWVLGTEPVSSLRAVRSLNH